MSVKQVLFLLYTLLYASTGFSTDDIPDKWYWVMHASYDSDQIVGMQNSFFYTKADVMTEYYELVEQFKNEKEGYLTACKYPARYLIIKEKIKLPNYELSSCKHLQSFIDGFHRKRVSIALATEYYYAPSSIFGHVMLVFHDNPKPEINSDLIHFSAVIEGKDNLWLYITKGLWGGYWGQYIREPLYKKIYEYNRTEQRFIYFYNLNLSEEKIELLLYHLYELRGIKFKYFFLGKNCAYQIESLLALVTNQHHVWTNLYNLPIDVLYLNEKYVKNISYLSPELIKSSFILRGLNFDDKTIWNEFKKNNFKDEDLVSKGSDQLKEGVYYFNNYRFRTERKALAGYEHISRLTFKNSDVDSIVENLDPLERQYPRKIQLDVNKKTTMSYGQTSLSFRPVYFDLANFQYPSLVESQMIIGEITISNDKSKVNLEEFKILNILLLADYNYISEKLSWSLYSGINKKNPFNKLTNENSIGVGQSYQFCKIFSVYWLAHLGVDINSSIRPYAAPIGSIYGYYGNNVKYQIQYEYKKYDKEYYDLLALHILFKKSQRFTWIVRYEQYFYEKLNILGLGLAYYFR